MYSSLDTKTKTNYNCYSYTIDICYWPSGSKEEQFPPSFEKKVRAKESATNIQQNEFREVTSTNMTKTTNINE